MGFKWTKGCHFFKKTLTLWPLFFLFPLYSLTFGYEAFDACNGKLSKEQIEKTLLLSLCHEKETSKRRLHTPPLQTYGIEMEQIRNQSICTRMVNLPYDSHALTRYEQTQ